MIRRELRRSAAACLGVCVLAGVTTTRGFAETWRWNYVMRTPNLPPLEAQSTVIVNAGTLSMRYTIPSNARQIVIEACRARLDDVAGASTMQTHGRTFLLVHLKPQHSASCGSGSRPALALPIDDTHYASEIVAAIDAACCGAGARVAVRATPSPRPSPVAAASPVGAPVAALAPGSDATDGTFVEPKLIKRGSSRLAIGITGTALVRLVIAPSGMPEQATVVTISDRRLWAAAIETAVSSTFAPARHNGKPVSAKYVATFSFDGEDPALSSIPMWKRSPLPAATATPTADASPTPAPTSPASPTSAASPPSAAAPPPPTSTAPPTSAAPPPSPASAPPPTSTAPPTSTPTEQAPNPGRSSPPPPQLMRSIVHALAAD